MISYEHIDFYILAGGKNSRMGKEKALLPYNDKETFVEHLIHTLSLITNSITIISENKQLEKYAPVIKDSTPKIGPMGGIYTAMQHSQKPFIFISPCDAPNIKIKSVEKLIQSTNYNDEILVFSHKNQLYPLSGIYATKLKPQLQQQITIGNYKMQDWLHTFNFKSIPATLEEMYNINTLSDFYKFQQIKIKK